MNMPTTSLASIPATRLKRVLPLILLIAAIGLVFAMGWHRYLTFEELARHRDTLRGFVRGNYGFALGSFMAIYVVCTALSIPGALVLTVSGGFLFGTLAGTAASVSSATLGAIVIFLATRAASADFIEKHAGEKIRKVRDELRKDAVSYLLFLRLVPIFPFWLVNIAPALAGISLKTYIWVSFVGIIPGSLAFTLVGTGLDSIIVAQERERSACLAAGGDAQSCALDLSGSLVTTEVLIAFAALGVVSLIPAIARRLRARLQQKAEG
jgi:uncharacterized membrane protein YdjX (TVP38/TMEM64 family)